MPPRRPPRAPMRAPSLVDCVCLLYAQSDLPVREIARLAGITPRNVYAAARRRNLPARKFMIRRGRGSAAGQARKPVRIRGPARLDADGLGRAIADLEQARQRVAERATGRAAAKRRRKAMRRTRATVRSLADLVRELRDLDRAARGEPRPACPKPAATKHTPAQRRDEFRERSLRLIERQAQDARAARLTAALRDAPEAGAEAGPVVVRAVPRAAPPRAPQPRIRRL